MTISYLDVLEQSDTQKGGFQRMSKESSCNFSADFIFV